MKIPKSKRQKVVRNLRIGEFGYITPVGMILNLEGECFVEKGTPIFDSKMDDLDLKIKRVENGFIAYIHEIKFIWMEVYIPELYFKNSIDPDEKLYFDNTYGSVVGFEDGLEQKTTKKDLERELVNAIRREDYVEAANIDRRIKTFKG